MATFDRTSSPPPPPPCTATALRPLGCGTGCIKPTVPLALYAALSDQNAWRTVVDNETAQAFGAPFARSGYLRALIAGHGLVPGFPVVWPANISFEQILEEVTGEMPIPRAGASGFAVNVGAGDGKRADLYKKPMDPIYPLLEKGYGGLAIEVNRRYSGEKPTVLADGSTVEVTTPMAYASGTLPEAMAAVNTSGNVQIAWAAAAPETIGKLLLEHGAPTDLDALHVDLDGDELPVLRAILAAGYTPKAMALNFNPDLPPPIRMHLTASVNHHGRKLADALVGQGLSAATADALYDLLSPRWSLIGFGLGRFSRWCLRCEQRMWFVRSDLLPGLKAHQPLTSWRQMVLMFWASIAAGVEMPKAMVGKLMAHSPTYAHWKTIFEANEGREVARRAWNGTRLGAWSAHNPAAWQPPPRGAATRPEEASEEAAVVR